MALELSDLGGRRGSDRVLEVEPGHPGADLRGQDAPAGDAVRVGGRLELEGPRRLVLGERVAVGLGDGLVHLDHLAVRQPHDAAGLAAVQHEVPVATLQAEADALGDDVGQRRDDEDGHPEEPGDRVDREMERDRQDVVGTRGQQHQPGDDRHDAEAGARRGVARAVEDVVLTVVARHPALDHRIERHGGEQQPGDDQRGNEDVERQRVAPGMDLPVGEHPQDPLQEAHVEVGL